MRRMGKRVGTATLNIFWPPRVKPPLSMPVPGPGPGNISRVTRAEEAVEVRCWYRAHKTGASTG